jgi:hypothetical protein
MAVTANRPKIVSMSMPAPGGRKRRRTIRPRQNRAHGGAVYLQPINGNRFINGYCRQSIAEQREEGRQQKNCADKRCLFFPFSFSVLGVPVGGSVRVFGFPIGSAGREMPLSRLAVADRQQSRRDARPTALPSSP